MNETLNFDAISIDVLMDTADADTSAPLFTPTATDDSSTSSGESSIYGDDIDTDPDKFTCNVFVDHINHINKEYDSKLWKCIKILYHCMNGPKDKVLVELAVGQPTWCPVKDMKALNLAALTIYAKRKRLYSTRGWRWVKLLHGSSKKHLHRLRRIYAQQRPPKFQFGVHVPRNVAEAFRFDKENGDSEWADSIEEKLNKLREYESFRILP